MTFVREPAGLWVCCVLARYPIYFVADFDFESDLVLRDRFAAGGVVAAFPVARFRFLPFLFEKSFRVVDLVCLVGLVFACCSCFSLSDSVLAMGEPSGVSSCSSSFSECGSVC